MAWDSSGLDAVQSREGEAATPLSSQLLVAHSCSLVEWQNLDGMRLVHFARL